VKPRSVQEFLDALKIL